LEVGALLKYKDVFTQPSTLQIGNSINTCYNYNDPHFTNGKTEALQGWKLDNIQKFQVAAWET
jgi:hypothetical protein